MVMHVPAASASAAPHLQPEGRSDSACAAQPEVEVRIDGVPRVLRAGTSLAQLLAMQACRPESVATAVNGQFVPRGGRDARLLQHGDEVTCFKAIVGG